jgi:hypothetical protein
VAEDLGAEGVLKSKTACAAGGHCVAAGRPLGRKTGMPVLANSPGQRSSYRLIPIALALLTRRDQDKHS